MTTRIVGVHGVGCYDQDRQPGDAAANLTRIWAAALAKGTGPADHDLAVAYYAHHLRGPIGQDGGLDPDTLDDEQLEMLAAWDAALREDDEPPVDEGWGTMPARQMLSAMGGGRFRSLPMRAFALLMLRDVSRYLGRHSEQRRSRAREEVAATIAAHRASVVIAHSLGSVVAYEALCAHPELRVDLLITIGSPLAIRGMVYDRLIPPPGPEEPRSVGSWVNLADPGDVCAVPIGGIARSFAIDKDVQAPIGVFAFHSATKYLGCNSLAEILANR